jgi:hypothetical protein
MMEELSRVNGGLRRSRAQTPGQDRGVNYFLIRQETERLGNMNSLVNHRGVTDSIDSFNRNDYHREN